jgi:hypothetical protein
MDNQEGYPVPSRAEVIKLARESCAKNLSSANWSSKNQSTNKNKDQNKLDRMGLWKQIGTNNSMTSSENRSDISTIPIRLFMIRAICAFMLFLTVLLIDKFDVKIKVVNSKFIQEMVSSNQKIDDAEEFFVSFFEELVEADE